MESFENSSVCSAHPTLRPVSAADFIQAQDAFRPPQVAATALPCVGDDERRRKAAKGCFAVCAGGATQGPMLHMAEQQQQQQHLPVCAEASFPSSIKVKEER